MGVYQWGRPVGPPFEVREKPLVSPGSLATSQTHDRTANSEA